MVTFEQARRVVSLGWPDYEVATFGYETEADWILTLLPETMGGRSPFVSKKTGNVRWINSYGAEYDQSQPVGVRP